MYRRRGDREYPYNLQGVFQLSNLPWDKDVLAMNLCFDHFDLDRVYEKTTDTSFWDDVRRTIMKACPRSEEQPYIADLDYDLYFALKCKNAADFHTKACKVKQMLEQRAEKVYLRPGVPKLYTITKNYLKNKTNLVMSLIEFQEKYGYKQTRELVVQYGDVVLTQ